MSKYNVDLLVDKLGLKITGTITSDDIVVPPPPPPPPPPLPPVSDVSVTVTSPAANALLIGSITLDCDVVVGGVRPQTGMVEYEVVDAKGKTILTGRQGSAPWTHDWDTAEVSDGIAKFRAVWIDSAGEHWSAPVTASISNRPVIDPEPPTPGTGTTHRVSTDAELTAALLSSSIKPGDRILLAPGKYTGTRRIRVRGLPNQRILIEAEKLGQVTIDMGTAGEPNAGLYFDTTSNYTLVRNLVITSSKVGRSGEHAHGINVIGGNHRVEHCVLEGGAEGYFWSAKAVGDPANPAADALDPPGAEFIYAYHNGFVAPGSTRGNGHAGYAQGNYRQFNRVVSVGGWGMGARVYGSGDAFAECTGFDGCVAVHTGACFNGAAFGPFCYAIGGKQDADGRGTQPVGAYVRGYHSWSPKHSEGGSWVGDFFSNAGRYNQISVSNCYWVGGIYGFSCVGFKDIEYIGNTMVSDNPGIAFKWWHPNALRAVCNDNRWYGSSAIWRKGGGNEPISTLPALGTGNTVNPGRPPDSQHVYPSKLSGGKRALVVVYNWSKQPTVTINLPWTGKYTLRNALDILAPPLAMGEGNQIVASMSNQTIVQPRPEMGVNVKDVPLIFDAAGKFLHPGQEFGCFVVEVE